MWLRTRLKRLHTYLSVGLVSDSIVCMRPLQRRARDTCIHRMHTAALFELLSHLTSPLVPPALDVSFSPRVPRVKSPENVLYLALRLL